MIHICMWVTLALKYRHKDGISMVNYNGKWEHVIFSDGKNLCMTGVSS